MIDAGYERKLGPMPTDVCLPLRGDLTRTATVYLVLIIVVAC